ncbi:MAG: antitoxin family protein [Bythopirellula sp.]|nr:antitoxin family protein [Bythopirellula sp.]
MQEFHAIYENGVLRPLSPLGLPELTEVVATVRPAARSVEKHLRSRSVIGSMSDYADELDEIVEEAMRARETQPFRSDPEQ